MSARAACSSAAAAVWVALATCTPVAAEAGGDLARTRHGDPATGVLRVPEAERGACIHCHDPRAGGRREKVRCEECHAGPSRAGIFPGISTYRRSAHALPWVTSVDPNRHRQREGGGCVNCHDPHGKRDGSGLIPSLARAREETLCLGCHGGSSGGKDLRPQPAQVFVHPWAAASGEHAAGERAEAPASGATATRHAECVDCHNPHAGGRDQVRPLPPEASSALQGVARVRVLNGPAGATPTFTLAGPDDPSPVLEYEVCFRCHSSFAAQRPGARDHAVAFNPANASFHPVEAAGTNRSIAAGAFTNGWSADRLVLCSDCHAGDAGIRGPHASVHRHLLAGRYVAEPGRRPMAPDDLCFRCHAFATYADPGAPLASLSQSRFNAPSAAAGHAYHVGGRGLGCHTCHETHGSPATPNLVALGRSPGLLAFSRDASGGTCTTTCHAVRSYGLNYPR